MMRGRQAMVVAVRRPSGDLAMNIEPLAAIYSGWIRKTPLLRGVIVLLEAMLLGMKSLFYSARISLEEEEEELTGKWIWTVVGTSLLVAVGLFFIAPLFLTKLASSYIQSSLVFHIIEGVVRLGFFVAYLWLISFVPDIKRVFAYHGAEHMTVNAQEHGVPLEVEEVKKFSTAHVRCGTSFLFVVLIIAIVVFALVGQRVLWEMILARIILIPLIASLGYEAIYFGAKYTKNKLVRVLLSPGLLLQSLTTGKPDDSQVEVAIAALTKVIEIDELEEAPQVPS